MQILETYTVKPDSKGRSGAAFRLAQGAWRGCCDRRFFSPPLDARTVSWKNVSVVFVGKGAGKSPGSQSLREGAPELYTPFYGRSAFRLKPMRREGSCPFRFGQMGRFRD